MSFADNQSLSLGPSSGWMKRKDIKPFRLEGQGKTPGLKIAFDKALEALEAEGFACSFPFFPYFLDVFLKISPFLLLLFFLNIRVNVEDIEEVWIFFFLWSL